MLNRVVYRRNSLAFRTVFLCSIFLLILFSQVPVSRGQGQSQTPQSPSKPVPVVVDGKELFLLGGTSSYPAKQRAAYVTGNIKAVAADPAIAPDSLTIITEGSITYIMAGKRRVLGMVEADAIREDVPIDVLITLYRGKIEQAIKDYRYDREPKTLFRNSGYSLALTLLAGLILWAVARFFVWFENLVHGIMQKRIKKLETQSHYIIQADQIMDVLSSLVTAFKILTLLVIIYIYLNIVLSFYPWSRQIALLLFTYTLDPLYSLGQGLISILPNIFFLVILFFITRYILKLAYLFFAGIEHGRIRMAKFERELGLPTFRLLRIGVIALALVVAYPQIPGSSSEAFKGLSIFFGVVFSLGSTSIFANIVAGYTILYRRSFKIGDLIKIGDTTGFVMNRSQLTTRLRTLKNEEVIVPNSTIINNNIVNYNTEAQANGLILHTTVGIGYEVPWRQVEAMLLLAAERTKGLRAEPKPFILQKALGDFAITYELNVYCDDPRHMMKLYSDLHRNILDIFNEFDVQIMTPNYIADTQQPKTVPRDRWFESPATKKTPDV